MTTDNPLLNKTPRQRLLHALIFEGLALVLCAPVVAWAMQRPLLQAGSLTLAMSLVAMAWNLVFNWLFDRLQARCGFRRGLGVRIGHALLFELGLVVMLVPLAAWWLSIGLWQALLMDIGLLLFFLPYTVAFNYAYDQALLWWLRRNPVPVTR